LAARIIEVEPFDLVVFGGTGDLAARKLLPALYHRDRDGQIPAAARIVAVSRRAQPADAYGDFVRGALAAHVRAHDLEPEAVDRFLARISYVALDATGDGGWAELRALLAAAETHVRAFYLAVAPDLFVPISERIARFGLITPQVFGENQIFRIDHYLGKETVQNLMALRFANALFEPLWNAAPYRPRADHRGRDGRRRRPRRLLRHAPARCATWCRTTCCSCSAWWRWSRRPRSTPTRCATRSSRCCAR
jgi:glucose-6-phosphate 1-dehydrogenase